jgi:hypothetical protein
MTLLEIFLRDGLLENEPNILAEIVTMKTCTNCGQKKPNQKFVEQCGDNKFAYQMCEECRKKARITPEQATNLIQSIKKRIFS